LTKCNSGKITFYVIKSIGEKKDILFHVDKFGNLLDCKYKENKKLETADYLKLKTIVV
jgi:hypothetical protein